MEFLKKQLILALVSSSLPKTSKRLQFHLWWFLRILNTLQYEAMKSNMRHLLWIFVLFSNESLKRIVWIDFSKVKQILGFWYLSKHRTIMPLLYVIWMSKNEIHIDRKVNLYYLDKELRANSYIYEQELKIVLIFLHAQLQCLCAIAHIDLPSQHLCLIWIIWTLQEISKGQS